MVTTVSQTVCTRIQPLRRFRHEACRVMIPAEISAVRARSIACRIVSISDSVSTRSFLTTSGAARARTKRSGVQPGKCRNAARTANAMMNSRRHVIATKSVAAAREPSMPAVISCGARPMRPTHTSPMNAASGSTMPADTVAAGTMLCRLPSANISATASMTARPGRLPAVTLPAIATRPNTIAPFGVIRLKSPRTGLAPAWR